MGCPESPDPDSHPGISFAVDQEYATPHGSCPHSPTLIVPPSPFFSTLAALSTLYTDAAILQQSGLSGTAVIPKTQNDSNTVIGSNIVFVQCDPSLPDATLVLQAAVARNPSAVILFSNESNYCSFTPGSFIPASYNALFTSTNHNDFAKLTALLASNGNSPVNVVIATSNVFNMSSGNNSAQNSDNSQSVGPSPSTAVAMIILYSITGVITALFLIIIVTGAVRAHRHPERYGPRNIIGRPRESRARGLGRAILDTIPIVKFGEKDAAKPDDVEMSPAGEGNRAVGDEAEAAAAENNETAPAVDGVATTAAAPKPEAEGTQGCSICTEDFERGQDVRVLPCNHSFHPACIDPWLLNVSGTCPLW